MSTRPATLESLHLLALDELRLDRDQLATELRRVSGLALRRTGNMAALALLACLRCTPRHSASVDPSAPPTLVLWHSGSLVAEETTELMRTMIEDDQGVMPFNFLASQPALLGLTLQPHLGAELVDAIYLPWPDDQGADIWPRSLQLAALWLREGRCARVLCLRLDRAEGQYGVQTLVLGRPAAQDDSRPHPALARLGIGAVANGVSPPATQGTDFFAILQERLHDRGGTPSLTIRTSELYVSVESCV